MPEPTFFLNKNLGPIRPAQTRKAAIGALNSFIKDGLFIGQSQDFLNFLTRLAEEADDARRQG